ncbi:hypothetical protein GALMADRAFT_707097 [Galerina marginata CBS 339.88]|uniref:Secreted protein n=1 Tax=Galerina marginata (strain CBS 339.88) TaxID=685588 RepID=A0A067TPQ3_GALM3|nr:hypothetical protein GALMADRAFT_707097 [Galerina marginata CBS 339.88]
MLIWLIFSLPAYSSPAPLVLSALSFERYTRIHRAFKVSPTPLIPGSLQSRCAVGMANQISAECLLSYDNSQKTSVNDFVVT